MTEEHKPWQDIVSDHQIRVTYRDTDHMGFAYYANYLVWFEIGRTELLRQAGHAYRDFEEMGYVLPVAHCSCKYKKPARYDDIIRIQTRISRLSGAGIDFQYKIYRDATGDLLAEGETRHAIINREGKIARAGHILEEWLKPKKDA